MPYNIIIDSREPKSIVTMIKELGIPVEVRTLETGDYILSDILIERKEIKDLFNSLRQGRLWNQLYNMKLTGMRGLLIIVGDIPTYDYYKKRPISKEKYIYFSNTISSIQLISYLSYNLGFKQVKTNREFIKELEKIWNYSGKKESKAPVLVKKEEDVFSTKINMLTCISGVGRVIAEELAKFPFSKLINLSEEEISNILVNNRKIGVKSKKIKEVLSS
uniref:Putative nuclease n=1 Tax=viral metagenome TaxID=1070528 RepID=A0A6M3XGT2_9ZZZZ